MGSPKYDIKNLEQEINKKYSVKEKETDNNKV